MYYYLNNFLFFSIYGHFFETIIFFFLEKNKRSGFLYFWWTPVYGLGVIISLIIYKLVNKYFKNKYYKNILLFISFFLILSLVELLGGVFLEKIFGYAFWNYSNYPLHIGKYICVFTSLIWTVFCFIFIYWLKKYTDRVINKIPKFITITLFFIFIIDNIFSILKVII